MTSIIHVNKASTVILDSKESRCPLVMGIPARPTAERLALHHLVENIGKITTDDLLVIIFSKFCCGNLRLSLRLIKCSSSHYFVY